MKTHSSFSYYKDPMLIFDFSFRWNLEHWNFELFLFGRFELREGHLRGDIVEDHFNGHTYCNVFVRAIDDIAHHPGAFFQFDEHQVVGDNILKALQRGYGRS